MDLRKVKSLIDLVSESDISELEISEGPDKVKIVKAPVTQKENLPIRTEARTSNIKKEDIERGNQLKKVDSTKS